MSWMAGTLHKEGGEGEPQRGRVRDGRHPGGRGGREQEELHREQEGGALCWGGVGTAAGEPLQDRREAAEFEGDAELVLSKRDSVIDDRRRWGGGRGGGRGGEEGQGVSHVVAADHVALDLRVIVAYIMQMNACESICMYL